ncbi:flavin monoamine oxidase family protein [Nitrospirillum iridis]|uniref:Tryptophan 2-monooxygenase n=1 Tax=Nitrospirillum iridis TaxID=765888 RepID=A0A7X0AV66_9PROT|nr:monoamine oxidase [Nitrospirillum iridis]
MKRRDLFRMIGAVAGSSAMYQAMTSLGLAADSQYAGPIKLQGAPKGTKVIVLGAGWAGLVSALELRDAGYTVELLEYNNRVGGRAWTIRGGDTITELGGETQKCGFDPGLYLNPGPWRIPYHHRGYLDYAKRFGVALEPFIMVNYNAYVHSDAYFGGKPQRFREVQADFHGHVAELLAKAARQDKLDQAVSKDDQETLLEALKEWGALDKNHAYVAGHDSAERRGYAVNKGGGLMPDPVGGPPIALADLLRSDVWRALTFGQTHQWQSTIFQPVGGMDSTPKAIGKSLADITTLNAKVTAIHQDDHGVTVSYVDARTGKDQRQAKADWCVCTLPLTVLSQLDVQVGAEMKAGMNALSYFTAVKTGLQFKRRFWEEDDHIYGGITFTDLPIRQIAYPNFGYNAPGKGVLLGTFAGAAPGFELAALSAADRVKLAVEQGARIHPQYTAEFETGVSVSWHRSPTTMGCAAAWTPELRAKHYRNLAELNGRVILAGDHLSNLVAWQEGAILSALDAITRLHHRIVAA